MAVAKLFGSTHFKVFGGNGKSSLVGPEHAECRRQWKEVRMLALSLLSD